MRKKVPIIKCEFIFNEKKKFQVSISCDKKIELMQPDELKYLFKKVSDLVYEKFTHDECSLIFREKYLNSLDSKQKKYLRKIVKKDFSGVMPSFIHICLIIDDYQKINERNGNRRTE